MDEAPCSCTECIAASLYSDELDSACVESTRRAPRHWQGQLSDLVDAWLSTHPDVAELDAAEVAVDLGIVGDDFFGEHLNAISIYLAIAQRDRCGYAEAGDEPDGTPIAKVRVYRASGERGKLRCPCCHASADDGETECLDCGAVFAAPLVSMLAASLAAEGMAAE